ncbi:MAG: hotdog fold thioesterase, partial [Chlorobi bacterium]|nr:hotdog fold thioesterase [Chlorobiota bacterium]
LLDEIMGKVLSGMDIKAPTRRLEVEYIRPVLIDSRVYLSAHHCSSKGRAHVIKGEVREYQHGTVLARGEAVFVAPRS